jgi:hypothetical protein
MKHRNMRNALQLMFFRKTANGRNAQGNGTVNATPGLKGGPVKTFPTIVSDWN